MSAFTTSQVTAGLRYLFAASPWVEGVKPVSCWDVTTKCSLTAAAGWGDAAGLASAAGGGAACLGPTPSQNPGTCLPWSRFPLLHLPRTISRVATHLDFVYSAEKPGAGSHTLQVTNSNSLITAIHPQNALARKQISLFSQFCLGSCMTSRSLNEGRIWPLISL